MPVEVTKYLCAFKCGTKAKSTMSQIKFHEAVCFKNPDRKACTTCAHEIYEAHWEGDGEDESYKTMYRGCKRLTEERFQELLKACDYHSEPVFHKPPVFQCPFWEAKEN